MVTVLFLMIANAVAIQCIGTNCFPIPYKAMEVLVASGSLELILEIRGFIKIFKRKDDKDN